ncbi:MAG TPA: hypothetical protein VNK41_09135 [Vicinamibacterales bacterium]|nr:hypothetical protein [Vicinamibacterales bacterium]
MSNPHAAEMEKAEGSRETVNANLDEKDPARGRFDEQAAERGRAQQADRAPGREAAVRRATDHDLDGDPARPPTNVRAAPPHGDKLEPGEGS